MKMKRIVMLFLLLFCPLIVLAAVVGVSGKNTTILNAATTTGASDTYQFTDARNRPLRLHKVNITGASGTATVTVEGNDRISSSWYTLCTLAFDIPASSVSTESCTIESPWPYIRHNVTAASGATITSTVSQ